MGSTLAVTAAGGAHQTRRQRAVEVAAVARRMWRGRRPRPPAPHRTTPDARARAWTLTSLIPLTRSRWINSAPCTCRRFQVYYSSWNVKPPKVYVHPLAPANPVSAVPKTKTRRFPGLRSRPAGGGRSAPQDVPGRVCGARNMCRARSSGQTAGLERPPSCADRCSRRLRSGRLVRARTRQGRDGGSRDQLPALHAQQRRHRGACSARVVLPRRFWRPLPARGGRADLALLSPAAGTCRRRSCSTWR